MNTASIANRMNIMWIEVHGVIHSPSLGSRAVRPRSPRMRDSIELAIRSLRTMIASSRIS